MTVSVILAHKGKDIVTIQPEGTLGAAVASLAEHRIGAIVVVDSHMAVEGIISERDVVRLIGERGVEALAAPLASVMTRSVVTCTPDETIPVIMERMTRGRFRHVPVVSGDKLVGIISIGDVVKFRVEEMERESAQLRDYIMSA
ncbi:CBS domain-containing protein [Xanthobacter autotrophicus DSM 431]|uniref:CBS domain-containing protein n=1 Tax=Xanthobacter nonsaccharivorans TaxID=3119912 RepID=UPI00372AC394